MVVEGTLLQEQMIARVRQLCQEDERIVGAFMYGSFTKGEGDAFSDIEFYVYYDRYVACMAGLRDGDLERAYRAAWRWGKEMIRVLAVERGVDPLETLIQRLDIHLGEILDHQ
jgi:predicted nucleotidyltransferase